MKKILGSFNMTSDNSVVIGSGILQALGIRKSHDIDAVVSEEKYQKLRKTTKYTLLKAHDLEIMQFDGVEIGNGWNVLGKIYRFNDFLPESQVIGGIRYITLDFLYKVKKSWVETDKEPRWKDVDDLKLIEEYRKLDR